MRKLIILIFTIVISHVNAQTKKPYSVTGKVDGLQSGTMYMEVYEDGSNRKDSSTISNGEFAFKGKVGIAANAFLHIKGIEEYLDFYLEPGNIQLTLNAGDLKKMNIKGSLLNDDKNRLTESLKPINEKYEAFNKAYKYADSTKNKAAMDSLDEAEHDLLNEKRDYVGRFVKANPAALISVLAIIDNFSYYAEATDVEPLYNVLDTKLKQTEQGIKLKKMLDAYKKTAIGQVPPDIKQDDTSGHAKSLSSLKGKYVLVDFWASWCGPCRRENPNIVKCYQAYKDKGFDIFSVSYDKTKAKWTKAIQADGLTWNHVSDLKGWQNATSDLYYIKAIPSNLLLDKNGKIIAKNLFGKKLEDKLSELMN